MKIGPSGASPALVLEPAPLERIASSIDSTVGHKNCTRSVGESFRVNAYECRSKYYYRLFSFFLKLYSGEAPLSSMATEQSPLLATEEAAEADHNLIYSRFLPRRKQTIVALIAWACFIPFFVSGSFIPAIPEVADEFDTDVSVVGWAVSIMWFVASFTGMTWATYATFYGRRVVYLYSMPCLALGSFGVSISRSVPELLFWRALQAVGSSAGMSTGMAIIGDIYQLEERGTAVGITFGALLVGPAVAPLTGGIVTEYASWRLMQAGVGFAALLTYLLMYFGMPETSHPGTRGVDKELGGKFKWVWLNPFKCLWYMRSPNLLALTFVGATALLSDFVLLLPISTTFGERYDIHSKALIGACFVPAGVGNLIGAPLAGRVSDLMIKRWRKKRAGKWVAEDRLRAALFGALWLIPLSLGLFGIANKYVDGVNGLAMCLACLFINGIGVDVVLTPVIAYNVDVVHAHSAEVMSAHSGVRNLMLATASTLILPAIEHWGVFVTNSVATVVMVLGALILWTTIRFGEEMRAYADIGYSTITDA